MPRRPLRRALRPRVLSLVLSLPLLAAGAGAQAPAAPGGVAAPRVPRPAVVRTLSTNPLAVPFGVISGEFERTLGWRGFAVGVGGLTTFGNEPEVLNDGGSETFRSLQVKLKYYPREEGLRGFAVGLTAGVAHERELLWQSSMIDPQGRETVLGRETRANTAPTLGATLDYNFLLGRDRRFLVGLGIGARRALGVRAGSGPLEEPIIDPRLQIGFAF